MKSILVLGDSISVHYGMYLKEMLCGFFAFHQKDGREEALKDLDVAVGGNGGDSLRLLGIIREKYDNNLLNYDYVLFNCGLHDIKRDPLTAKIQVTVGEYKANLYSIFDFLKNAGALPIWIRTKMVVDERHNSRVKEFKRYNRDVAVYNEAADSIVKDCIEAILADWQRKNLKLTENHETLLLINGFGATPLMELYLIYHSAAKLLKQHGVRISRSLVGNYTTALDMAGASVSLCLLDDEIKQHWDSPVHTASLRWGC